MIVVLPALVLIGLTSTFLFAYGVNLLYLSWKAVRMGPTLSSDITEEPTQAAGGAPDIPGPVAGARIVIQLPIYNERYVAERLLDAVGRLDWPRDQLEVQVLDDSDDDTPEIVASAVARWRQAGLAVCHVRRESRTGYKAGALAHGLTLTDAPLVAVFDADFVPRPDFLRRTLPSLGDPGVAFVQARWGHLNESYSLFTYLQSLMADFHFLVEQAVRPRLGYVSNFSGSAGVWRRAAIEDAGGWSGATLTEDLDLSYRAHLRGWRAAYVEGVVVPQELPVSADAYRSQQSRWATGSLQVATRLLWPVLASRLRLAAKFQATMHLLAYLAPLAMLVQIACYALLLTTVATGEPVPWLRIPALASLLSLAPATGMAVAQWRRGREWWWHWHGLLGWSVLGAGTSLTVVGAAARAVRRGGEFRRTPKYSVERVGEEWRSKAYFKPRSLAAGAELASGLAASALAWMALRLHQELISVYAGLFAAGFLYLGGVSVVQSLRQVRYELVAIRVRAVLPRLQAPGLVAGLGLALLLAARVLPDPFEDSYQHWLIAANLATTGRLQDPLFQMQDTWLPAYHLFAAALLRVFGIWQLGVLKAADVGLGIATLTLIYRLAGSRRRGLIAVALLGLNPIFVLTVTSAVAEPLLTLFLLGAAAAAAGRRYGWATVLACLACLTGTKAWLWLACAGVVVVVGLLSPARSGEGGLRRLAWVAPALTLAVVLQSTFGFASHSVARAAVEASSATARGSVGGSALARGGDFVYYFALASVPLVALAPLAVWPALRKHLDGPTARTLTLVALPSVLYLAVVTALVAAGVYSGSHRYYYVALPGLALAAAAVADRLRMPYGLVPVGAAAVVAAAFVPVVNGLVADNRGLDRAGGAAQFLPGRLMTDSPLAAYLSHKQPAEIVGSQQLPLSHQAAPDWLQQHGIGGLVLEDVSYYRATTVLPELIQGQPAPPFLAVGDEPSYTVPGGKRVLVYRVGPVTPAQVLPGLEVGLEQDGQPARGKTAPLAKGAVIETAGIDLAGEGMGFGVPIVEYPDGWHYPGHATTADVTSSSGPAWQRTYSLDVVGGDAAHGYRFVPAPSVGQVQVTYRVSPGHVRVEVRVLSLAAGALHVELLNEESAAFHNYADASGSLNGAAFSRWQAVAGDWARLRSDAFGVEWAQVVAGDSTLYAGRESQPPDFDWSGLDYQFGPGFRSVDYDIAISRGSK
jgi:cellulose synthase/poly-beta-1,6-N-acetylglucosamine synthase-like glycosyltransferase